MVVLILNVKLWTCLTTGSKGRVVISREQGNRSDVKHGSSSGFGLHEEDGATLERGTVCGRTAHSQPAVGQEVRDYLVGLTVLVLTGTVI